MTWHSPHKRRRSGAGHPAEHGKTSRPGYRTAVNTRVFLAFLQDRSEVRTDSVTSGSPNCGRGADGAVFAGIWMHSPRRLLLNA
jgi:hypothetical protein